MRGLAPFRKSPFARKAGLTTEAMMIRTCSSLTGDGDSYNEGQANGLPMAAPCEGGHARHNGDLENRGGGRGARRECLCVGFPHPQ